MLMENQRIIESLGNLIAEELAKADRTFVLTQKLTRKYDITDSLYFTVDDRGLPHQVGAPQKTVSEQPATKVRRPFANAFNGQSRLGGEEMRTKVMASLGMTSFKAYGNLLKRALDEGVILQRTEKRRIYYSLAGPE